MEEYSVRRWRQDCEMDVRSCCGRWNRTLMSISAGRERNLDVMYRSFWGGAFGVVLRIIRLAVNMGSSSDGAPIGTTKCVVPCY